MAIYHMDVQIVKRSKGRSVVAAAAYRAGEDLKSEYDGKWQRYGRKICVEEKKIVLPDNAPREYADRSTLWNRVEMDEKSDRAQLAREFNIALPIELTKEQQLDVVYRFVEDVFTSKGMIADVAVHNPPVRNDRKQPIDKEGHPTSDIAQMQFRNPHVHILIPMRAIDENGCWEKKKEKVYKCKRGNEEKDFSSSEFAKAKEEGWEKQFLYLENGKKVYYTKSEGEEKGLERVSNNPKSGMYGRETASSAYWNSKDRIWEWRKRWEEIVNEKFASLNMDIRISCKSFKDQGREDEIPTEHMGPAATNIERRAERELLEGKSETEVLKSDLGAVNRRIKEYNQSVRTFKERFEIAKREVAWRLEEIRIRFLKNAFKEEVLSRRYSRLFQPLVSETDRLNKYKTEEMRVKKANKKSDETIKCLENMVKSCSPLQVAKKEKLRKQIQLEREHIRNRNEYLDGIRKMCQYPTEESLATVQKECEEKQKICNNLKKTIEQIKMDESKEAEQYQELMKTVPENLTAEIEKKRAEYRNERKHQFLSRKKDGVLESSLLKKVKSKVESTLTETKDSLKKALYQRK